MRALVIGASGQDGILLSSLLIARGDAVVGASRRPSPLARVTSECGDVTSPGWIEDVIARHRPHRIFHLAAHHRSSATAAPADAAESDACHAVNTRSFERVLVAAARHCPEARILLASSCRVFGEGDGLLLDESTPHRPVCAYGASKAAAMEIAATHAREHGRFVASAVLFNHESELRPDDFVSKKIALAAATGARVEVGSLAAVADWSCARDHCRAMITLLDEGDAGPWVVASGALRSVAELAQACFAAAGLDWRNHVIERPGGFPGRTWQLRGDCGKLIANTSWRPRANFEQLAANLVERTRRMAARDFDPTDHRSYL